MRSLAIIAVTSIIIGYVAVYSAADAMTMTAVSGGKTVTSDALPARSAQQAQDPNKDTLISAAGVGFCCLHWNTDTFHLRRRIEEIRRLQLRLSVQYQPLSNYGAASMQSVSPSLALLRKYTTGTDLDSYFPGKMLPRWAVELMDEPLFEGWHYDGSWHFDPTRGAPPLGAGYNR